MQACSLGLERYIIYSDEPIPGVLVLRLFVNMKHFKMAQLPHFGFIEMNAQLAKFKRIIHFLPGVKLLVGDQVTETHNLWKAACEVDARYVYLLVLDQ